MNCPQCGHSRNFIKDSRKYETYVYRRRVCTKCNHKFSTVETLDERKSLEIEDHLDRIKGSLRYLEEVIRKYKKLKDEVNNQK